MPRKQPKRGRLRLNDGSCVRLRPERPNHVWAYDFVQDRTRDGRVLRMLVVVDEFSRECLAIRVGRRLGSEEVLEVLAELFVRRGPPEHLRSDTAPSSSPARSASGWGGSGSGPCSSSPGAPGRTAIASRSTASSGTSCWTGRSSTRYARRRS